MQTMLCIMYSQHLYEMQPLSFLLVCNLVAIFQREQGEQSKEDTYIPTIPYAACMNHSSRPPSQETSNAKTCRIYQCWLRQQSGETVRQAKRLVLMRRESLFFLPRRNTGSKQRFMPDTSCSCPCQLRKSATCFRTVPRKSVFKKLDCKEIY